MKNEYTLQSLRAAYQSKDPHGDIAQRAMDCTPSHYKGQEPGDKASRLDECWNHAWPLLDKKVRHMGDRFRIGQLAWHLAGKPAASHTLKACLNPLCFNPAHAYDAQDQVSKRLAHEAIRLPITRGKGNKAPSALAQARQRITELEDENQALLDALIQSETEKADLMAKWESLRDFPEHSKE